MPRRSKVEGLPPDVKAWLDQALVENNFSQYELLSAELGKRGYGIGKSSLHTYGQAFEERLKTLRLVTEQARAVVQAARDAVLLTGLAANRPAHPTLGGGVDRVLHALAVEEAVVDFVREVSSEPAVEEGADGVEVFARGVGDGGHGQRPRDAGVAAHRAPEAPAFVAGGGDVGVGVGAHFVLLRWCASMLVVTRCASRKPSYFWPPARSFFRRRGRCARRPAPCPR